MANITTHFIRLTRTRGEMDELTTVFGVWRNWFAWRPVKLVGGGRVAWLELVQRRWRAGQWEYDAPSGTAEDW